MAKRTLNDTHRKWIVEQIAAWEFPSDIANAFPERFGFAITKQAVECYDPTKYAGRKLHPKWREYLIKARENFRKDVAPIPIANKVYRLKERQANLDWAKRKGNRVLVNSFLDAAAKEATDGYSNERRHTGMVGVATVDPDSMPIEDQKIFLASLIASAKGQ